MKKIMRYNKVWTSFIPFIMMASLVLSSCIPQLQQHAAAPVKIAFIGDTGYDENDTPEIDSGFEKVLSLVKAEDADLLVILGDFSYEEELNVSDVYFNNINRVLGEDFPILAAHGNHDPWEHYEPYFKEKMNRMGLDGEVINKEKYSVEYRNIKWVLLGLKGQPDFVRQEFEDDEHPWKICGWHRNQRDMQAGGKRDEVGWETYQECQNAGAIIATAHEHSYSRTMTLTDLGNRESAHGATGEHDVVQVSPGRTFVFVSGLGGRSTRDFSCEYHDDATWWSTVFTSNYYLKNGEVIAKDCTPDAEIVEGYTFGATFITLNAGGDPNRGYGYFKTIENEVIDEFTITKTTAGQVVSR